MKLHTDVNERSSAFTVLGVIRSELQKQGEKACELNSGSCRYRTKGGKGKILRCGVGVLLVPENEQEEMFLADFSGNVRDLRGAIWYTFSDSKEVLDFLVKHEQVLMAAQQAHDGELDGDGWLPHVDRILGCLQTALYSN
jgi:hypothetical protein